MWKLMTLMKLQVPSYLRQSREIIQLGSTRQFFKVTYKYSTMREQGKERSTSSLSKIFAPQVLSKVHIHSRSLKNAQQTPCLLILPLGVSENY